MLAVALAVLMIAAAVVVLLPGPTAAGTAPHPAAPTAAARSSPAAAISYELYDGEGDYVNNTYYINELYWSTLTFYVYDALDHSVNVTITDPNASRDGVASPAYTFEAPINTSTDAYYSFAHGVSYTFPNLPNGGTWQVNFSAPLAGYVVQNITLEQYYVEVSASVSLPASVLPGQPFSVTWWAYLDSNGATPYAGATSVVLSAHYEGNGSYQNLLSGGSTQLPLGSWGTYSTKTPLNVTGDTEIKFFISVLTTVNGQIAENETVWISIPVGELYSPPSGTGLTYLPPYEPNVCSASRSTVDVPQGSTVAACFTVDSDYEDELSPAVGLPVTINYWNGTAHVPPSGGAPTTATTNASGGVEVLFSATSPPFVTYAQYPRYDAVNWSVTVPGANSSVTKWTLWENYSDWVLTPFTYNSGVVGLTLDHTQYYPGDTATGSWTISTTNKAVTGTITAESWAVYNDNDDNTVYATGTIGGTAQSGTFTFAITSAMVGQTLYALVVAGNTTTNFAGVALAYVVLPSLIVNPSSNYYTAGASDSVSALLNGPGGASAGTVLSWTAGGEWYYSTDAGIASGTVSNGGSFNVPVPATNPPNEIVVNVWATNDGIVIASTSTTLTLETGYQVLLGVATVSSYSDGSFQPGQTVSLSYKVAPIDGTPLPQVFSFVLTAPSYTFQQNVNNVGPSGTIAFTIPSNAPAGQLVLDLRVASGALIAGPCVPAGACQGATSLLVNPNPSVLNLELGAGSGLTVGWLILLVLLIVVAIALFLVMRRRGGSARSSGGNAPMTTPLNPPAPAPSTPPASEWKESPPPGSSDSSPPPLPPPSGSS
jgi:hypothetical protein